MKTLEWVLVIGGAILVAVFIFGAFRYANKTREDLQYTYPTPVHPFQLLVVVRPH
jgi:uncharacterized membrane protein